MTPRLSIRTIGTWLLAAAGLVSPVRAAESVPMLITLGGEVVRLPSDERVGLAGGAILFGAGDEWWFGPAVYGAASGSAAAACSSVGCRCSSAGRWPIAGGYTRASMPAAAAAPPRRWVAG